MKTPITPEEYAAEKASASPTEPINHLLATHQETTEEWTLRTFAAELYRWSQLFILEFKLKIPAPVISLDPTRREVLGTFHMERDGLALDNRINVNLRFLDRPFSDVLRTLFHELLHEWQKYHGKPSKSNYHNKEFIKKALEYGLIVEDTGKSHGVQEGLFTKLLRTHEVPCIALEPPEAVRIRRSIQKKLQKWFCPGGCDRWFYAYVNYEMKVRCEACDTLFARA